MKKAFPFYLLLGALSGLVPLSAQAGEYHYDQEQSRVSFSLSHLRIITVSGHFKIFSGSFRFDPDQIENSTVNIRIETASVESGIRMRDKDLRSEKFFWAERYPEIHFVSREFKQIDRMNFDIYGDLTIRGITRPVVFKTEFLSEAFDAEAGRPLRFRSETHIKRKDFGLGTGNWLDPILFVTDETLKISLEIHGLPSGESLLPVQFDGEGPAAPPGPEKR